MASAQLCGRNTVVECEHSVSSSFLQKVWDFVKNHQNLSIWPKLETFRENYHVLGFSAKSFQPCIIGNCLHQIVSINTVCYCACT